MKHEHDKYGLRLWPQKSGEQWAWYYETPRGMQIIVQPRAKTGELLCALPAFTIPWKKVCGSVDRYRKHKR
jgi:hypothetical protein